MTGKRATSRFSEQQLAEEILAASRADATMAVVTTESTVNVRWADNELTTNGATTSTRATALAVHGAAPGASTAGVSRPAPQVDPAALAEEALAQARAAGPAWDAMALPETGQSPQPWDDPTPQAVPADLAGTIAELGAQFEIDAGAGRSHYGYLELTWTSHWLATSLGLRLRFDQPAARLELTVKADAGARSTWGGFAGPDLTAADVPGLAERARVELGWQERRGSLPAGRHTAILTPSATADLLIDLLWGADARAAAEGRSAFSTRGGGTRLGEPLSPRPLRLWSDPAMPGQPGLPFLLTTASTDSASVFDNGLPLAATDWIADGRLAALVSSRAVASHTGLPLALEPDNLALDAAGSGTIDDLIARTPDGLLVTCTWYNRMVDPQTHLLTGLTRDGVYQVRGGEVVGAVGNYRFNESPLLMLERITDASAAEPTLPREMGDYAQRATMPALVVADFGFSSQSDAT